MNVSEIIAFAVKPIIENANNEPIQNLYNSLMNEILSSEHEFTQNFIQKKMDCLIGEEFDCEYQYADKEEIEKYWAYIAMTLVKEAFSDRNVKDDRISISIFKQLNLDLDNAYIDKMYEKISTSQLIDLHLENSMELAGNYLLEKLSNNYDARNKTHFLDSIISEYRNNLSSRLKKMKRLSI